MKQPNILAALIAPCAFIIPPPAYGVLEDPAPVAPDIGTVTGDQPPDWSALDKLHEGEAAPDTIPGVPSPVEKAAQVPKPAEVPPTVPDPVKPPEEAEKPPENPPAAQVVPPVAPTPDAKAPFDPAAATKKIGELEISPKASATTKDGFANLKAITAQAVTEVETLRAKLAEAEKRGGLTPEVEGELVKLREFYDTWGAEHDPEIVKPYAERATKAEEGFLKMLVEDPDLTLPQAEADTIKKAGFDSAEGKTLINGILKRLQEHGDPLLYERVKEAYLARNAVHKERDARINEVREKQGGYVKAQEAQAEQARTQYGAGFNEKMVALVKGVPWLTKQTPAADATPEAKALAEKHNAWIDKDFIEQIRGGLAAAYHRDPAATAEIVYKAVAHDQLAKERDALVAAKTQLEARVAELEETARGVQTISKPAPSNVSPVPAKGTPNLNMTSDEAIDDFLAQKAK